jgi:hypothetical protein
MRDLDRIPPAAYTAALGVSVLLISLALWRTNDVQAQNDADPAPRATVEPAEDPALEPALLEKKSDEGTPEEAIRKWPEGARAAARAMIAKYGEPNRFTEGALVWIANGPWRKTVVYRSSWPSLFGRRGNEYVEQTVAYKVPVEKVNDLKRFDQRLLVNEDRGLLSSRSESEPMNFLALNLADEIVMNKRTVEDARDFYVKTAKLSESGKSSRYMDGLRFRGR